MKPTNIKDIPCVSRERSPVFALPKYVYQQTGRVINTYFVQEKFNGIGFRAKLVDNEPVVWTTRQKTWAAGFFPEIIINGLAQMLIALPPESILLGEFTCDGIKLATLGGQLSVNSDKFTGDPRLLRARPYDVILPEPILFEYRHKKLQRFVNWQHPAVRAVPTFVTDSICKIEEMYNDIVADGGEGVIIRFDPCLLGTEDGTRHPMILKWKKLHEAEGTCVSVYEGEGKRTGLLGGFVITAVLDGVQVTFNLGGGTGLTDEQLRLYLERPPINKQITFTYEELSINNTPLRAQFVAVRDYEY